VPDPAREAGERARPAAAERGVALATPPRTPQTPTPPPPLPRLTPLLGPTVDTPPRTPGVPDAARSPDAEFEAFLDDVRAAVADTVAEWRARLRAEIARWRADGFVTTVLERALRLSKAPDVDGLISTFEAAAQHL